MAGFAGGFDAFDRVDHVHTFDYFTKHRVAPALYGGRCVVKEAVVANVDEELRGSRMRLHSAGHGHGADLVGDAIVGFVLDSGAGSFLLHARLKATALNHEIADDPVENSVVVMTVFNVLLEVGHGFRGFVFEQLEGDNAVVGVQLDHVGNRSVDKSMRRFNSHCLRTR